MRDLILLGAGGHCVSCIDVIGACGGFNIIGILGRAGDVGKSVSGVNVIGIDSDIEKYVAKGCVFIVAVGHLGGGGEARERLFLKVLNSAGELATVVSPYAYVSANAVVGCGTVVMHGAVINAGARVESNCIINTLAIVEHGAVVKENTHISTGAVINGDAVVGAGVFFGSNAVSKHGVRVPDNSFVKAGDVYVGERKKKGPVAFLTVLYPGCREYLEEFSRSVSSQSYTSFDLIVVNDGFGALDVFRNFLKGIKVIELHSAGSIAKNREVLIRYALNNGYSIAVFGDADDYFSDDRVAVSVDLLNECDVVVNDIFPVSSAWAEQSEGVFGERLVKEKLTCEFIADKNVFGMSNTAVRLEKFRGHSFVFDESVLAVDWLFFSFLMHFGAKAKFSQEGKTYYRQHGLNIVGAASLTDANIDTWIKIKKNHYRQLINGGVEWAIARLEQLSYMEQQLEDKEYRNKLLSENLKCSSNNLWWEIIEVLK